MGVNAYTTNLGVRERQSTYVPMPFEEMYAALQEKQKRYDVADQYERENKKLISAFSSPIAEHNAYLNKTKQNFLTEMTKLHTSMPDKGSSEYLRKTQDIVDGFFTDPNYNLIQESNKAWEERTKIVTQQMANGIYSGFADQINTNFRGTNPDGTLKRYMFAGLRPKVDINKSILTAIQMTPDENQTISVPRGNSIVTQQVTGKKAEKIYANMLATLGTEGMQDYMFENNLKTPAQFNSNLYKVAKGSSNYAVSVKVDPNYEMEKLGYARELHKMTMQEKQLDLAKKMMELNAAAGGTSNSPATSLMQFPNANNSMLAYNEGIANMIKPDGSLVEGVWEASPWSKMLKEKFPAASETFGLNNPQQNNSAETELQNLVSEQRRNILEANKMNPGVNKLTENAVRQRYKNSKKTTLNVHKFDNSKDSQEAKENLFDNYNGYTYYAIDGENLTPLSVEQTNMLVNSVFDKKSAINHVALQGKLNAFNTYGPEAVSLKVIGEVPNIGANPSIVAVSGNSENKLAVQEHLLAVAYTKGTPQIIKGGYIDPMTGEYLKDKSGKVANNVEVFWKHFNDTQSSRHIVIYK
jgi:hypothetical protein